MGIVLEWLVVKLALRFEVAYTTKLIVVTNLASALIGFMVMYPIAFFEPGMNFVAGMIKLIGPIAAFVFMPLFSLLILVLNTVVELHVAHHLYSMKLTTKAKLSFIFANVLSMGVVFIGVSQLVAKIFHGGR